MQHGDSVIDTIVGRYQVWMRAIRDRDLEAVLDIYADDATYMPPGKPAHLGKQALRDIWTSYLEREDFVANYYPTIHVSDAGDMAYDTGRYRITMKKEGRPVAFEGKYVVVWRLIDQRWKAVVDIDNDSGPTA